MKLSNPIVISMILILLYQPVTVITFTDLGFDLTLRGETNAYKESIVSLQEGLTDIFISWKIYLDFAENTEVTHFEIGVNETYVKIKDMDRALNFNITIKKESKWLKLWLNISLKSGEVILKGNSTVSIYTHGKTSLNSLLTYLYALSYVAPIAFLVYRRLTVKARNKGEIVVVGG